MMELTVKQCADSLHVGVEDILRAAKKNGLLINDQNDLLSLSQAAMIEQTVTPSAKNGFDSSEDRALAARNMLEHYVSNYKIFMDTSSLLNPNIEKFTANLTPLLEKYHAKIILPKRVIDELYKHQSNSGDPALAQKARRALQGIQVMLMSGQAEIRGEESDNFADNVFQVVFTKFRMTNKLLLITEDKALAKDILALNQNQSVRGNPVAAKRLSKYGYLAAFSWENTQPRPAGSAPKSMTPAPPAVPGFAKFRDCTGQRPEPDAPLAVSAIPAQGDSVYVYTNDWQLVPLGEKISFGSEASVYRIGDPRYVIKVFNKESLTRNKREKVRKILQFHPECEGICFPAALVYNLQKEFVGYLMPMAKGKELQRSVFIKPVFLKTFPGWKRRDTVQLCITILEKIRYLHERNILMGDLNPGNVLVASPTEVCFVDTDSYQIETLPSTMGTVNFTAPEIQDRRYSEFLRTVGNENFAIATLLFMIMLPGKAPYAQQGGGNQIENIKGMNFSYPLGDQGSRQTPDGPWRFIWSHLTYDIKDAFFNTFRAGGRYSTEPTRLGVDEWLRKFRYYMRLLDDGKLRGQDPMSEELFPTRLKLNPKITYGTCSRCRQLVNEKSLREGLCPSCLNEGEAVVCKRCGKEFLYTYYQRYIKKQPPHTLCPTCAAWSRRVTSSSVCSECGRSFEITNGEADYFKSKNLALPKKCIACRRKAKFGTAAGAAPAKRPASPSPRPSASPAPGKPKQGNGSSCFITTAVCEYFGKPDTCPELQALRRFRDEWLAFQPGGSALIDRYYQTAPAIVQKLKASPLYAFYCESLWKDYLAPCLAMIERGEYEACRDHYQKMVKDLARLTA